MGNFDKKHIKRRTKEERRALKQEYREMRKKGIKVTKEFKKDAQKAARKYSVKQEVARRKRIFKQMGGKEEDFNENVVKREVQQDFRDVENSRLIVRVAAFLTAAGLTLGIGPKLLPDSNDDSKTEENGYEAGEIDEGEAEVPIIIEDPDKGDLTIEVDPEEPWIEKMPEGSETPETPETEFDSNDERNISEEVYFKLKESSTDEIMQYCKDIYANIYQEKTGEEIDPNTIEIKQEYKGYSYNVTLPNGQKVIILHEGNPIGTEEQLENISGITYEKAVYENQPYYIIYEKTPEGSKLIDGSVDGKTITTMDNLKAVLKDEQTINRSASKIPDNIWEIMILAMTGDKNLSNEQLIELSRWIRDNELEESVLDEQSEVEEHTDVGDEVLEMVNDIEENQKQESSKRETFVKQLTAWQNQSNATTSRENENANTQQNQQKIENDGR